MNSKDNKFIDNHAPLYGGALFLSHTRYVAKGLICEENTAIKGGGQCLYWDPSDLLGGFNEDDSDWSAYTPVIVSENIGVAATTDKISSAPYKIIVKVPHHHILNSRDPFANPPSFEIVYFYNTPAISMPTSVMTVDLDSSLSNGTATFMGESSGSIVDAKVILKPWR